MTSKKYLLDQIDRNYPGISKEDKYRKAIEKLNDGNYSDVEWEEEKEDLRERIFTERD